MSEIRPYFAANAWRSWPFDPADTTCQASNFLAQPSLVHWNEELSCKARVNESRGHDIASSQLSPMVEFRQSSARSIWP